MKGNFYGAILAIDVLQIKLFAYLREMKTCSRNVMYSKKLNLGKFSRLSRIDICNQFSYDATVAYISLRISASIKNPSQILQRWRRSKINVQNKYVYTITFYFYGLWNHFPLVVCVRGFNFTGRNKGRKCQVTPIRPNKPMRNVEVRQGFVANTLVCK